MNKNVYFYYMLNHTIDKLAKSRLLIDEDVLDVLLTLKSEQTYMMNFDEEKISVLIVDLKALIKSNKNTLKYAIESKDKTITNIGTHVLYDEIWALNAAIYCLEAAIAIGRGIKLEDFISDRAILEWERNG